MNKKFYYLTLYILITIIIVQIPSAKALDISIPAVKVKNSDEYSPETVWELGYTGEDIAIAIIDGGIDDEHPDLKDKFIAGVDLTQPESSIAPRDGSYNPDDIEGAGTACAGCVMSTGVDSNGKYEGSAPNAKLIDIKIYRTLDKPGILIDEIECLIDSFNWAIEHKADFNIKVISCSINIIVENSNGMDDASLVANKAVKSGIVVVTCAMNDGPDNNGFYGVGAADEVITVGAVDDKGTILRDDDNIADFSNRGPRADDGDDNPYDELKPDIVAPGVNIETLSYSLLLASGYVEKDGTSYSTPIVAGIIALMLEANPNLTPSQIKDILHKTAEQRGEPSYPNYPYPHNKWNPAYGYGIVDAYAAVKMALDYKGDLIKPPILNPIESPDKDGNYKLIWSKVEKAKSYLLLEATNPNFINHICYSNITDTYYDFFNKDNGTYYYKVMAKSSTTISENSNVINVKVERFSNHYLNPPFFLNIPSSPSHDGNYELQWSIIEGANNYLLQEDNNHKFLSPKKIYFGDKNSLKITNKNDGIYYYRIKAIDSEYESKWSEIINITVKLKNGEKNENTNFIPAFEGNIIVLLIVITFFIKIQFKKRKLKKLDY